METMIRRKITMATHVREFCRAHPYDNAGYAAAVEQLEAGLTRADVLAQQEESGHVTGFAIAETKADLKWTIRQTLRSVADLAARAATEDPQVRLRLRAPSMSVSHPQFVTRARLLVTTAREHLDLLAKYGVVPADLDRVAEQIDRFETAVEQQHDAKVTHVGARADLKALADELLSITHQLDAINRVRFREDAEALARWNSTRDVAWPMRRKEEAAPPTDGQAHPAA